MACGFFGSAILCIREDVNGHADDEDELNGQDDENGKDGPNGHADDEEEPNGHADDEEIGEDFVSSLLPNRGIKVWKIFPKLNGDVKVFS